MVMNDRALSLLFKCLKVVQKISLISLFSVEIGINNDDVIIINTLKNSTNGHSKRRTPFD